MINWKNTVIYMTELVSIINKYIFPKISQKETNKKSRGGVLWGTYIILN